MFWQSMNNESTTHSTQPQRLRCNLWSIRQAFDGTLVNQSRFEVQYSNDLNVSSVIHLSIFRTTFESHLNAFINLLMSLGNKFFHYWHRFSAAVGFLQKISCPGIACDTNDHVRLLFVRLFFKIAFRGSGTRSSNRAIEQSSDYRGHCGVHCNRMCNKTSFYHSLL